MTRPEALAVAARRGPGYTVRRDSRRRGGFYVRTPAPRISAADWADMVRRFKKKCMCCCRRARLVKEHPHRRRGRVHPTCGPCNLALGHLARAGVRTYRAILLWAQRAGALR